MNDDDLIPPSFDEVKEAAFKNIESLSRRLIPNGTKKNGCWVARVPWRADKNPSLSILFEKACWQDFGRPGDEGSMIDLVMRLDNCNAKVARDKLADILNIPFKKKDGTTVERKKSPPKPTTDAHKLYKYSPTFYVGRWDAINGHDRKRFSPYCWDGKQWQPKMLIPEGARPLYGDISPNGLVLVVEGERTARAAANLICNVVTWSGGAKTVKYTDWSPLKNREVIIWPDNDDAGRLAAADIQAILPQARVLDIPKDFPEGWDLADAPPAGWTQNQVWAILEVTPRGTKYGPLLVLKDADAQDAKPRDYYLKGLLSPNEMSVFYGEPGCGKSFFALYVARAIAQGRGILGRRVKPTKILFMALEGISGFEKRLKAEIETNATSSNFRYIAQPINLFSDKAMLDHVISATQGEGAGLIIIDTLNRAMAGGSENDPADMGQFIQNIDAIRAATEAHVLIIHHSGKDASRGMRGHSALLGAADVSIEVAKDPDSKQRVAKVLKAKDDADGDRFAFFLDIYEMGNDADGDPITTCTVREADPGPDRKKTELTKTEKQWMDCIRELFTRDDKTTKIQPMAGMSVTVLGVKRESLREWFRTRGLIGISESVTHGETLTGADRTKMSRILTYLISKGKIAVHEDWVWIV